MGSELCIMWSFLLSLSGAKAFFNSFSTQKLQWQSFADTAYTHLFPDGQYAAGSGRAELKKNSTNLMPAGVPGNGDVLGAKNPQTNSAPRGYAHSCRMRGGSARILFGVVSDYDRGLPPCHSTTHKHRNCLSKTRCAKK